MTKRPRSGARLAAGLAAALMAAALPVLATSPAPAAAATSTFALTTFRDVATEPSTGRVFVSGDDKVLVFDSSGTLTTTIASVFGAGGLAIAGGHLWVPQTTAASVAKISLSTLTKVAELPAAAPLEATVARSGDRVLFATTTASSSTMTLKAIDPATDAVTTIGTVQRGQISGIDGPGARAIIGTVGGTTRLYDLTTTPPTSLATGGGGQNLREIAVTDAGTYVSASGAPYRFDEWTLTPVGSTLPATGVVYPGTNYPNGIDFASARGGVLAGTTQSTNKVYVSRRGIPTTTHLISLPGATLPGAIALAPSADRVHVVVEGTTTDQKRLVTESLAPTLGSVSTSTVLRGRTTRVQVTGTGLASITGATLGGAPVDFQAVDPNLLVLDVRTGAPVGPSALALTGPFGDLSVPITIAENPVGSLSGRVTRAGVAVGGATVELYTPDGGSRTTTSAADGTWSMANVGQGPNQDLAISAGTAKVTLPDQELGGLGRWSYDVDLLSPPTPTVERRRLTLPPGTVRRVVTDPASGRTFVAVGDQVVAFSQDGRELRRFREQWTASDLQVVGSKLWVMLHRAGRLHRIDIPTLTIDDSVTIGRPNTGSMAVVGTRAFFTSGDSQWTQIAAIDLATDAITTLPGNQYAPIQAPIQGSTSSFLSWEVGISSSDVVHWDASTITPTAVATTPHSTFGSRPNDFAASAPVGKAWNADGRELSLATMQLTGVRYPSDGAAAVAWSPGRNGVLAFGRSVAKLGTPAETHRLTVAPAARSLALDGSGDLVQAATTDGSFVVSSLAPQLATVSPSTIDTQPTTVTVTGTGIGGATGVRVDGQSVGFTPVDASTLTANVVGIPAGVRELTVTTPWGTSSPLGLVIAGEPQPEPWEPFDSWSELITRQHLDLTGAPPTPSTLTAWSTALQLGTQTPGGLIESLRRGTDNTTNVDPVARLYRAFLGRTPDAGGLEFWIGRKRAGTWKVTRMADHFASSSEFVRKYGTLTNRQFVTRIYTDVMGRPADPSGVDYWTGKLDRRERTRGQVMVGFSESSEYKRKQSENTDVAVVHIALLDRSPTDGEVAAWVTRQKAGTPISVLAGELLASEAYAAHITG